MADDTKTECCTEPTIMYWPPAKRWQRVKCKLLGLPFQHSLWKKNPRRVYRLPIDGKPKECKQVVGDGNCYFRAISFWLTGSEDHHLEVRALIVKELLNNASLYAALTPNGSVRDYLRVSRMSEPRSWGTEMEVYAAATLLQTPISVFAQFGTRHLWQTYYPLPDTESRGRCMLYLINANDHFEPVVDV